MGPDGAAIVVLKRDIVQLVERAKRRVLQRLRMVVKPSDSRYAADVGIQSMRSSQAEVCCRRKDEGEKQAEKVQTSQIWDVIVTSDQSAFVFGLMSVIGVLSALVRHYKKYT